MADLDAIISQSIQGLESADTGGDSGTDPVGTDAAIEAETEATAVEADTAPSGDEPPVDAVAVEAKEPVTTERPKKWVRRDQVQKEIKAAQDAHAAALSALETRLKGLSWAEEQATKDKIRAIEIAEQRPDLYVHALMADERYPAIMLAALKSHPNFAAEFAAAKAAAQEQAPAGDMPQPEQMADGSMGYTQEGIQKLLAWSNAKAVQEALTQAEAKFGKKYDEVLNPIVEETNARRKYGDSLQRTGEELKDARAVWPKFAENEPAMKAWLRKEWGTAEGKTKKLIHAYMAVVVPKFQADRDTMRKELVAEMRRSKTAGTQVNKPATNGTAAPGGKRSIESIILGKINELDAAA